MPVLLLDKEKCLGNLDKMARKAAGQKLSFRPHCKTHQSAEIANWTRDFGVNSITVSSFPMARYFAQSGWKDILVAFPFQPGETENLIGISGLCRLSILVDSPAALPFLNHIPNRVDVYVDVDTGYGRTGIRTENPELMEQIIVKVQGNPHLEFRGFYCHAGHSYKARDLEEADGIHRKALGDLGGLKKLFKQYDPRILYGDTPNCSMQEDFGEIDEITAGNFFFYDLVQNSLGACCLEEIAVALECPVAGRYPAGERILIHGGGIHFSKESMSYKGSPVFGRLVHRTEQGWTIPEDERFLTGLSQEHGIIEPGGKLIREVNIGDLLLFLPVHSCMSANLMREYWTLDGTRITTMNSQEGFSRA
jgi:D-serine deaminase-like pyridoxal phosphate-dependent protein